MRVCLFTDTLADVNGVSRFIRDVADLALASGRDLHVVTSTRLECPVRPNMHVVPPRAAMAMPRYEHLELAWPPMGRMLDLARALGPDVVHVSTPGPVGLAGVRIARRLGVPLIGTYHTDFPAYIDHLFDDAALTWLCTRAMRWFYRPFARIFTRSAGYIAALAALGIGARRIVRLAPGIATETFHPRFRDPRLWERFPGVRAGSVKVLYVGRVSVEKNLPLLTRVWMDVGAACRRRALDAQLIVVGDGPYRAEMGAALAGADAHFLGFRHGGELSVIYASSDVFAFPSTTDTLGQVVMEAQGAGLPVLVTDAGGPAEVVDDGRTGLVLGADDGRGWSAALMDLIGDGARRRAMGAAAHAKIHPMSVRRSFDQFWQVHQEACAECSVGADSRG